MSLRLVVLRPRRAPVVQSPDAIVKSLFATHLSVTTPRGTVAAAACTVQNREFGVLSAQHVRGGTGLSGLSGFQERQQLWKGYTTKTADTTKITTKTTRKSTSNSTTAKDKAKMTAQKNKKEEDKQQHQQPSSERPGGGAAAGGSGHKHPRAASTDDVLKHPSTKRAKEIDGPENPMHRLQELMSKHNENANDGKDKVRNVLHWFRSKDLRAEDNRALHAAAEKASSCDGEGCLLACFLYSPQDIEWHGTSPARTDFMLQGLKLVQEQLEEELHIPLVLLTAEDRGLKTDEIVKFVKEHDVSHVYANVEYEVDELRRDIDMFDQLDGLGGDDGGVKFVLHHDQTVVEPGELKTGAGGPMKVFTPYHKSWLAQVASEPGLVDTLPAPRANDKSVKSRDDGKIKKLFGSKLPRVPKSKEYASDEEKQRLRELWPPGHAAGIKRLHDFLDEKVDTYSTNRSEPAADNASRMSAYFSSGMVSVREALDATRQRKGKKNDADFSQGGPGGAGVAAWVRELVFREFYRHVMVVVPHSGMNLPQNLKFDFVQWEDDEEGWKKWCEGRTGVPFVDAGMRQINHEVSQ